MTEPANRITPLSPEDIERALAVPVADRNDFNRLGITCPQCGSDSYSTPETRDRVGFVYHRWVCNSCDHSWSGRTAPSRLGDVPLTDDLALYLCFREALRVNGFKIVRDDS